MCLSLKDWKAALYTLLVHKLNRYPVTKQHHEENSVTDGHFSLIYLGSDLQTKEPTLQIILWLHPFIQCDLWNLSEVIGGIVLCNTSVTMEISTNEDNIVECSYAYRIFIKM